MKKKMRITAVLMLCLSLCLAGCGKQTEPEEPNISRTGFYFDTVITITCYDTTDETILDRAFALAKFYDHLFSTERDDSDISLINAAVSDTVTVDPETAALLSIGKEYYEKTDGRFALTIGALSSLWGLSSSDLSDFKIPSEGAVENALDTVDDSYLEIEGNDVTLLDPEARLDCGGIAKGYIADRIGTYLRVAGVKSAIINLGGNVLTIGSRPDGKPFRVGIQEPFAETGTPIASLAISGQSLVTSGVYERYTTVGGELYHHILDTKTGYPVRNSLLSVTILSEHSVDGDALSTAVFSMGLEKGAAYVESLPGIEAVFVTSENKVLVTSGLTGLVEVYSSGG